MPKLTSNISNFNLAINRLGFTNETQDSFIKILYLAGYLTPVRVWEDLNRLKIKPIIEIFNQALNVLHESAADQLDSRLFNPKILIQQLFQDLSVQDSMDFLLYQAQHAFNRNLHQERNELQSSNWMVDNKESYLEAAKNIGLLNRIEPDLSEYDQVWVLGASRIGMLTRLIDLEYILKTYQIKTGQVLILAGEREIWTDIDGISPDLFKAILDIHATKTNIDDASIFLPVGANSTRDAEGKEYIQGLAARNQIELDLLEPLIEYLDKGLCPAGRFIKRCYPNYKNPDGQKLTETSVAQDLLESYFPTMNAAVVHTLSKDGVRPNTGTTAQEAARQLLKSIQEGTCSSKEVHEVLVVTNNPYIQRQTLGAQSQIDQLLSQSNSEIKIQLHGSGFSAKQDVATTHSEFGALIAELFMADRLASTEENPLAQDFQRDIKELLFQTRDISIAVPEMPADQAMEAYDTPYMSNEAGVAHEHIDSL